MHLLYWHSQSYISYASNSCQTRLLNYYFVCFILVLLQRGADPSIRNTDGKTALDVADPMSKSVLTGPVLCSTVKLYCDLKCDMYVCRGP